MTSAAPELSRLEHVWFVVARSRELAADRPVARSLLGRHLVLFRDARGAARALEDRCLHRGVALSGGRVHAGTLACPYHGWRYGADGACVAMPCAVPGDPLPKKRVPAFEVRESEGSIWARLRSDPSVPEPRWAFGDAPGYAACELVNVIDAPMGLVLNNFVDSGHTGFVHAGLFRAAPRQRVRVRAAETPTGVRVETFGETNMDGLAARLLLKSGETIVHTDEVFLPHTVRVDYHLGGPRHVVTVSTCAPETDARTRVTTRFFLRFPPVAPLLLPVMKRLVQRILDQDKVVLENQAAQHRRYGRDGLSSRPDVPADWVDRALVAYCNGTFPPADLRAKEVEFLL